ncbi:glycosyltransferase family 4 protein [Cohnella lupini]|uniref:Glycosyltransferase involved in cell wall biosynthesis n=1 Tax=Cohnella lupini TaxID=1294267 RepID=A0A3D9HTQ1_9BACL|nr:glycosyltransferase [Cohnella lupini]RED52878.1 glycosyltransferase involved in cell wall biosynthesis [Cohnella lupini]
MNGVDGKPKLMFFSHICSPVFVTGAEKLLLLFAREMVHRFHCVMVVPQSGAIAEKARSLGIRVIVLDIPLCISLYTAAPSFIDEIEELKKHPSWSRVHVLLAEERPDYVLSNTSVHPLPAMAAKSMGIPTIWALMETIMDRPSRGDVVSFISGHSDIVIGISHTTLEPIRTLAPAAKTFMLPPYLIKEELLPNSWVYHRFRLRQQYGWGEYHRVAGYLAATIYANKGLEQFLKAMLPIVASDVKTRALVIGNSADDVYYRHCQKLVQQSGYGDRFLFLPFAEQIQHAYPVMDVVVVPSLVAEGFGMTALEGLVFGKGVVAFASGGLNEILSATGNEAYLANTGDVNGLTERVNILLSNEGLLRAVGERNMQTSLQVFGVEAFRSRLDDLIAQLPNSQGFHRTSLWRGSGPTVFLIENGVKRPFASELSFRQRGYLFNEVTDVPDGDLHQLPSGHSILELQPDVPPKARKRKKRLKRKSNKRHRIGKRRLRPSRIRKAGRKAHRRRR